MNYQKKVIIYISVLLVAIGSAALVYYLSRSSRSTRPEVPAVKIDKNSLDIALKRFNERAKSVHELDSYQKNVMTVFKKLNLEEITSKDIKDILSTKSVFEQATQIGSTGNKERYILLGDWAAYQFNELLFIFLNKCKKHGGVSALIKNGDSDYGRLVESGGNFIVNLIKQKALLDTGELLVPDYIPQIVFRRRWRMLGGLPDRYEFMEIEALADNYYLLTHTDDMLVDRRLHAVKMIKRYYPEYDEIFARAVVYYEGKETERSKAVLKRLDPKRLESNDIKQFLNLLNK
ncbi:MAG: hypothetical protein JXR91_09895 [Deltaproteobacteria bacterium]|nr:hypothetical protein [Deltaproteobacteria bacterium]